MDPVTQVTVKRFRLVLLVVGIILPLLSAFWCAWLIWSIAESLRPRVKVADVERSIRESVMAGSSRENVIRWVKQQAMIDGYDDEYWNKKGKKGIEAWILNTTPCVDIRLLFFFDKNGRLDEFKVKEEGRFTSRNHD